MLGNEYVIEKLGEIMVEHGVELCSNVPRLNAFLQDYCAKYRKEINLLIMAVRENIVQDLLNQFDTKVDQHMLSNFVDRLYMEAGIEEQSAKWAIFAWCQALNKNVVVNEGDDYLFSGSITLPDLIVENVDALVRLLEKVPDGTTVKLKAGVYELDSDKELSIVGKSITLLGEGSEVTKIIGHNIQEKSAIRFEADGKPCTWTVTGITFEQQSKTAFSCVSCTGGNLVIQSCRCLNSSYVGLSVSGSGGEVIECEFTNNFKGIFLSRTQNFKVQSNQFRGNETGLAVDKCDGKIETYNNVFDGAEATSSDENDIKGMMLVETENVIVESNQFTNNSDGVAFHRCKGQIELRNNKFEGKSAICGLTNDVSLDLVIEGNNCIGVNDKECDGIMIRKFGKALIANNNCRNFSCGISIGFGEAIVESNQCYDNISDGIFLVEESNGEVIRNHCYNNKNGIFIACEGVPAVRENQCINNSENGILLGESYKGEVEDNHCSENGAGIHVVEQAAPTLKGNRFHNNEIGILFMGFKKGEAINNHCSENEIGIGLGNQAEPVLIGNICKNNVSGIQFGESSKGEARENNCCENEFGIIVTDLASPIIDNNICRQNTVNGIWFGGESKGIARNNECTFSGKDGIVVQDSAAPLIEANKCCQNGEDGIFLTDNSNGTVIKNESSFNEKGGIAISEEASAVIEKNNCIENKDTGIIAAGIGQVTIEGNEVTKNGNGGIVSLERVKAHIIGNECQDNYGSGIIVQSSAPNVVIKNHCIGNKSNGIQISAETTQVDIMNNKCCENPVAGIMVINECACVVEGNECFQNGAGVAFKGSTTGKINDNRCCNNKNFGILVKGQANTEVLTNKCNDNIEIGISLEGSSKGLVKENECNGNKIGIQVIEESKFTWKDNHCYNNIDHNSVGIEKPKGFLGKLFK